MGASFKRFIPDKSLSFAVDAFWLHRRDLAAPEHGPGVCRVLPDGCIDLIFQWQSIAGRLDRPRLFASALIERVEAKVVDGNTCFLGARFRPGMSRLVLDVDPHACRNRQIEAIDIERSFASLESRLAQAGSPDAALRLLKAEVAARIARYPKRGAPSRVREALAMLDRAARISDVARGVGVSERSLHRELCFWTGLRPKALARILRMQRVLRLLRVARLAPAAAAYEAGYADQSHLTRELRRMAGFTPAEAVSSAPRPNRSRRVSSRAPHSSATSRE